MRRGLLLLSTLLIALAVVPAATANKPIREVNPAQEDVVITDQCSFPVLGHVEGSEVITTFTDRSSRSGSSPATRSTSPTSIPASQSLSSQPARSTSGLSPTAR